MQKEEIEKIANKVADILATGIGNIISIDIDCWHSYASIHIMPELFADLYGSGDGGDGCFLYKTINAGARVTTIT